MRFLVDLYRVLILFILAVALIAGSWLAFSLIGGPLATSPQRVYLTTLLIGGVVTVILGLGITATFISIHDRIAAIALNSERAADALERQAFHGIPL